MSSRKLRWGVISTARIATNKVIPAIQRSERGRVVAIASRSLETATVAGAELEIERCYGSYEELLADPEVDAIYNPLPNHLHVPWTLEALEAGKHVLCEKPLALSAGEARSFLAAAAGFGDLLASEAFMYKFHPQWLRAKAIVDGGSLGALRSTQTWFSYFTDDPNNIRHVADWGGGGLMDIGCYPVSQARWLFGCEPTRVTALTEIDERFGVDRLTSALLAFPQGQSTFTCSTQLQPHQRVQLVFEEGRYEIEIPMNAPSDRPTKAWLHLSGGSEELTFETCDQYGLQADAFAEAVFAGGPAPVPLSDAVANMAVLDALAASARDEQWKAVADF